MLRIGEFSILSQISINMLRHYNEIELLNPEHIDKFTGYRYYSEDQLPVANKIRALKSMGLSLTLIKEILTKYSGNDSLKSYLEVQALEQREKIAAMQKQLTLVETTVEHLNHPSSVPSYSVAIKDFPKHTVISYRSNIASPNQEGILWQRLTEDANDQNVQLSNPHLSVAIFHDEGFVEENLDVEVQKAVIGNYHDTDFSKFKIANAFTAATLTYKGHYSKLPEANEAIARWIADNHYRISGPRFNIYHISPETESSYDDMVTEVCFPVEAQ